MGTLSQRLELVQEFLLKHELHASQYDMSTITQAMLDEMEAGLQGKSSSLPMLPSFITLLEDVPVGKPLIVLDAGGTNFRSSLVTFQEDGEILVEGFKKRPMPGIDREVSADEFYGALADHMVHIADKSDHIGFCFSYATEILPSREGIPLYFSKEVKAKGVLNKPLGEGLLNALAERGVDVSKKKVAILNDTVATLLAAKARTMDKEYSGYIGFILGTGTNTAYLENGQRIGKIDSAYRNEDQIVNMESGCFGLVGGDLDQAFDGGTKHPGESLFEKKISGAYLGPLVRVVLQQAAKEGLFSPETANTILALESLSNIESDDFMHNPRKGKSPLTQLIKHPEDITTVVAIIDGVVERATKLAACNLSAVVLRGNAGEDPSLPICINADGTTFYKNHNFAVRVHRYLQEFLVEKHHRYYEIIQVDNSPTLGAALAGAL